MDLGELAGICGDVHAGRRRMNRLTLEAVGSSARRLAEIDEALWTAHQAAQEPRSAAPA